MVLLLLIWAGQIYPSGQIVTTEKLRSGTISTPERESKELACLNDTC